MKIQIKIKQVELIFEEAGNDDVIRKVVGDLDGEVSGDEVRAKLSALTAVAVEQIEAGE